MVTNAKIQNWRQFVTEEGNKEPWGIVYKTALGKLRREEATCALRTPQGETSSWRSTAEAMLTALVPDDDVEKDTPEQLWIREDSKIAPENVDCPPFRHEELGSAIARLKRGKCPGPDRIESEVVQEAWSYIQQELLNLVNACLEWGYFPRRWKIGNVVTILKGPDRDKSSPKSYRPICLLSMIGKLLERLMAKRMAPLFHNHILSSERQFGFRPGKSTEDAIVKLRGAINEKIEWKYILAIALDISGAFDNVWWPNVLHELKRRNCAQNLYKLTQSYFTDRRVQLTGKHEAVEKLVTMGCPQGSILGPSLWNIVFDDLLAQLESEENQCEAVAYADDIIILVGGNSREELRREGQSAVTAVSTWCSRKRLALSAEKTEMLLVKGKLDAERPPTIRINGKSLRMRPSIKYLGVHLERGLRIEKHVQETAHKCRRTFNSLAKVAKANWGLGRGALTTLYRGLFVPIATYAAAGWSDLLNLKTKKILERSQRMALLQVTKAYRTISTEALQVIAGEMPIDLVVEMRARMHAERKGSTDMMETKRRLRDEAMATWQERWRATEKGRTTYAYFSSVHERVKDKWIHVDHYVTQFLSGHGDFNSKLKYFGCNDTELCDCGEEETPRHIIEECPLYDESRRVLKEGLDGHRFRWPVESHILTTRKAFRHFRQFARDVLSAKEKKWQKRREGTTSRETRGGGGRRGGKEEEEEIRRLGLRRSTRLAQAGPNQNRTNRC